MSGTRRFILMLAVVAIGFWQFGCDEKTSTTPDGAQRIAVVFSGGHETEPVDRGRPVNLIAGALGVKPQVFRDAFSGVRPARGGGPTGEQARENKRVLMAALGPHGVTNDRLDEVSNYYRYRPQRGEMWPTRKAEVYAIVENGSITRFEIADGGSGYHVAPIATIPGYEHITPRVDITFSADFDANGSVVAVQLPAGD